jgi:hypothetical protein
MKKYLSFFIIASLILVGVVFFLIFSKKEGKLGFNNKRYVALVGKEGIKREDFEKEISKKKHFFNWAKQEIDLSSLEKDVIDTMIDFELVNQYAKEKNITVGEGEVIKRFNQLVQGSGEPEEKLLSKISQMYGMKKTDYLEVLKKDILKEKVQESLGMPLGNWLEEQRKKVSIVR